MTAQQWQRIEPLLPQGDRFDQALYCLRNRVERLINRLKQFRRLATRYEKRAENYRALAKTPDEDRTTSLKIQKIKAIPFFIIHFGLFWLVHGVLLTSLFAPDGLLTWQDIILGRSAASTTMVVAQLKTGLDLRAHGREHVRL